VEKLAALRSDIRTKALASKRRGRQLSVPGITNPRGLEPDDWVVAPSTRDENCASKTIPAISSRPARPLRAVSPATLTTSARPARFLAALMALTMEEF
jgi:hypothetical protein